MDKNIIFVTHNKGKVLSAQKHFKHKGITLDICEYELDEPRSDDIKVIAKSKVMQAYNLVKKPCFALDTGFYIEALNGFPRAFVNFSLDTLNLEGILKLMEGQKNRKCCFKECLAYSSNGNPDDIQYFYATIKGTLSDSIKGNDTMKKWSDLWYIFIPEGYDLTLAEMTEEQREKRSNTDRNSAIKKFADWI